MFTTGAGSRGSAAAQWSPDRRPLKVATVAARHVRRGLAEEGVRETLRPRYRTAVDALENGWDRMVTFRKQNATQLLSDMFDARELEEGKPVLHSQRKVAA